MKDVTDMPKEELQQKLQRHIDDARLVYQAALVSVCVQGPPAVAEYKRAAEMFVDLARAASSLSGE